MHVCVCVFLDCAWCACLGPTTEAIWLHNPVILAV